MISEVPKEIPAETSTNILSTESDDESKVYSLVSSYHEHAYINEDSDTKSSRLTDAFRKAKSDGTVIMNFRMTCGTIANSKLFVNFILFLIALNSILMGVATFEFVANVPKTRAVFVTIDKVLLIFFTLECALQLIYNGINFFTDAWLVFDFTVVMISWPFDTLQIVRCFRIFRSIRVLTRFEAMRKMVDALGKVLPSVSSIVALTLLLIYIFAVAFTELFKHLELSRDYFTRLDKTAFTLLQFMTLDYGPALRETVEFYPAWGWLPFVLYVMIAGFVIFNLIVGSFCDAVSSKYQRREEQMKKDLLEDQERRNRIMMISEKIASITHHNHETQKIIEHLSVQILSQIGLEKVTTTSYDAKRNPLEFERFSVRKKSLWQRLATRFSFRQSVILSAWENSSGSDSELEYYDAKAHTTRQRSEEDGDFVVWGAVDVFRTAKKDGTLFTDIRIFLGRVVNHQITSTFVFYCIIANSIMMGIGTYGFVRNNPETQSAFNKVDKSILIIFTTESSLQLIYHALDLFRDVWLFFDLTVVVLSWSFDSFSVIRAFRILRTVRVISRVPAMRELVEALFDIVPRMSAIIFLSFLLTYIFSVSFTELFKELILSREYFTRLDKSAFTLLQIMTIDNVGGPMREVLEHHPYWGWIPFVTYLSIAGFILANLVIASLCYSVAQKNSSKHDEETKEKLELQKEELRRMNTMEKQIGLLVQDQLTIRELIDYLCDSLIQHSIDRE